MNLNLGLPKDDFDKLVKDLQNGDEKLFEITFKRVVRRGIKKLKLKYKNDNEDIEDAAMETLLTFRKRLIDGKIKYGALDALFNKILFQEYARIKRKTKNHIYLSSTLIGESIINEPKEIYDQDQLMILRNAYEKLSKECVEVLENLYEKDLGFYEIAKKLGKSESAIRKRNERCLDRLRAILLKSKEFD